MHSYRAYGVGFHSVLPLPELEPSKERADVEIQLGDLGETPPDIGSKYFCCWQSPDGTYLYWKDVGTFLVQGGRKVTIDPQTGVEDKRLRLILLGAVFSIVLQQRGHLVFHASALEINESAVIFVGNKGWGKSTLASMLHRRGHNFLADDVVAIDDRNDARHLVIPAFPQIKLWSDAVSSLGDDPERFPTVSSVVDKRDCRLVDGYLNHPVPLRAIYVLGSSGHPAPEIVKLGAQESLIYLIAQSYNARWGKEMFAKESALHLKRCGAIIRNIPVYRLARPRNLELLPLTAQMIEDHVHTAVPGASFNISREAPEKE